MSGTITVSSGVTSSGVVLNSGGLEYEYVLSGGIAIGTTVINNGKISVLAGGVTSGTVLSATIANDYGSELVYSGGVAIGTTLNLGQQTVYSGGTAIDATVNYGGEQVIAGGTAIDTMVINSGYESLFGGSATGTTVASGGYVDIYDGAVTNGTTVNGGYETVYDGTTNGTTVNNGGLQDLEGGTASGTMVNQGGEQDVTGGVATGTMVNSGGLQEVSRGLASGSIIDAGGEVEIAGGVANGTTISSGGSAYIYSGSVSYFETVNSGGAEFIYGTAAPVGQGSYNGYDSGGTAYVTTVYGSQTIFAGGKAGQVTVDGGVQYDYGETDATALSAAGAEIVGGGGIAIGTTVASDTSMTVSSGGVASGTVVDDQGSVLISSGGAASGTIVNVSGSETVGAGGNTTGDTLDGGTENVGSGGTASGTTVNSGASLYVSYGGTASGAIVSSSGVEVVYAGGVTADSTLEKGGAMIFENIPYVSGGTATLGPDDILTVTEGGTAFTVSLAGDYLNEGFSLSATSAGATAMTVVPMITTPVVVTPAMLALAGGAATALSGVSVTDNPNDNLTVVVSDSTGLLSTAATAGVSESGEDTNSLRLAGTAADINAELATLTYQAAAAGGTDWLWVSANNASEPQSFGHVVVTATPPAPGAPVVAAPASLAIAAGTPAPLPGISVADGQTAGDLTIVLSDTTGLLSAAVVAGVTETGEGSTSLTLAGDEASLNNALTTLTDQAGTAGTDQLSVSVTDAAGEQSAKDITVTAAAAPEAPVVTTPVSLVIAPGATAAVSGVSVADGQGSGNLTVIVSDSTGLLSTSKAAGVSATGENSNALTLVGTEAALNADLATLTFEPSANGGADLIWVSANNAAEQQGLSHIVVSPTVPPSQSMAAIEMPAAAARAGAPAQASNFADIIGSLGGAVQNDIVGSPFADEKTAAVGGFLADTVTNLNSASFGEMAPAHAALADLLNHHLRM